MVIFFIIYFCTALCLYCWGCYSDKTVFPAAKSNNGNFFIVYFCTALCLYCWGCYSAKSWADCESQLQSQLCPRDEKGSVCQIEEYTETKPGGVSKTHYFKTCGLQSHCDGSGCNIQEGNVTHTCVFHCCCYDNCNTGILWVNAGCHWLSQICYAVPTCRMLVFNFKLKQITELPWLNSDIGLLYSFVYNDTRKIYLSLLYY